MGSLGVPAINHHLYNFGNIPVFGCYGAKYPRTVMEKDGTVKQHWFMDYKFTLDERICDGHYYASAFKIFREILKNPEILDTPVEKIEEDID